MNEWDKAYMELHVPEIERDEYIPLTRMQSAQFFFAFMVAVAVAVFLVDYGLHQGWFDWLRP